MKCGTVKELQVTVGANESPFLTEGKRRENIAAVLSLKNFGVIVPLHVKW